MRLEYIKTIPHGECILYCVQLISEAFLY